MLTIECLKISNESCLVGVNERRKMVVKVVWKYIARKGWENVLKEIHSFKIVN